MSSDFCDRAQDVRFAYFQKCEGIVVKDEDAKNIPFLITVHLHIPASDNRTRELKTLYFQRMQV